MSGQRREKVTGKVLMLDRSLEDTLPYLFALLGIEEQPSPLQQMDPQIRRRRTFEALKKLFLRESLNQPLILIFEDLHWIDSETQGFLDTLSESVASAKLLLLVNYRPEYRHEWGQKTYYTQLRLSAVRQSRSGRISRRAAGCFCRGRPACRPTGPGAQRCAPTRPQTAHPGEDRRHAVLHGRGGADVSGRGRAQSASAASTGWRKRRPTLHISPTVQGVLAARIDRLAADEKALLQQLAVIGREFPLSLVRQVITQPEDELYRLLSSLQRKEFLYEQPAFPEVEYIFKHALTQEVAYGTVLHERRKALHERTAQAMEALYRATLDEHYSELAHHYTRSGNTEKAVEYLHLAGQQAVQRSANVEAITSSDDRLRAPQNVARHPRARPTRTHAARHSGRAVTGHQRFFLTGSESYLYPRPGAVPAGRGDPPALPGPLWAADVSSWCGASFSRRASWGSNSWAWPSGSKTRPCSWRHIGHWAAPYSIWVSSARPRRTWSRA